MKVWLDGRINGLCARDGFVVHINWKDGKLVSATVHSKFGNRCRLRYGDATREVKIKQGRTFQWDGKAGTK